MTASPHRCNPPGLLTRLLLRVKPGDRWLCRCGQGWTWERHGYSNVLDWLPLGYASFQWAP